MVRVFDPIDNFPTGDPAMTTMQSLILSVTSLVSFVGVLTPLIWAAIQDGHYDADQRTA
jgi:hypothetical protein